MVNIVNTRGNLEEAINRAQMGERITLQQGGKSVAALISMDDLALQEELAELENQADIRAAKKALKETGSVSLAKIKTRLGMN